MKTKKWINGFQLTVLTAVAALVLTAGCSAPKPAPDPLAGWTFRPFDDFAAPSSRHHYHLPKAITEDYQNFITKNRLFLGGLGAVTGFYENGTGQHAVEFEAFPPNQNATWHYVLIYDKENKRIKVIRFGYSRIQS